MSDRLRAIVDRLDIQPDDRVLEIGCGHGVAASFVCERVVAAYVDAGTAIAARQDLRRARGPVPPRA